jgi:hypothetical protein
MCMCISSCRYIIEIYRREKNRRSQNIGLVATISIVEMVARLKVHVMRSRDCSFELVVCTWEHHYRIDKKCVAIRGHY